MTYQSPNISLMEAVLCVYERLQAASSAQTGAREEMTKERRQAVRRNLDARAKMELLAALIDGAVIAKGQLIIASPPPPSSGSMTDRMARVLEHRLKSMTALDEGMISGPERGSLIDTFPFCEIGTDWWSGIGLEVEINWIASALARQRNGANEIMRRISVRECDLWPLWPGVTASSPTVSTRGRRPIKTTATITAMQRDLANYDLAGATEEELAAKYRVSRDICRKARNAVLNPVDK